MRTARRLLLALLLPAQALAASASKVAPADAAETAAAAAVDDATTLLSRYPAGLVPVDPGVMGAIATLGADGGADEISLLRNLVENERAEVRQAASRAIADIRERQHAAQRESFAGQLPDWPDLEPVAAPLRESGLGREEAACVAYANLVLGEARERKARAESGDAAALLASGRPHKALAAAVSGNDTKARLLEARALEDLGDVRGAVQQYARLAALGNREAHAALDGYGIDTERLLLGLFARPDGRSPGLDGDEARVLEVLIRHGGELTVQVLTERTRGSLPSDRATAADALARMLEGDGRAAPLDGVLQHRAERALAVATRDAVPNVGTIASEALKR